MPQIVNPSGGAASSAGDLFDFAEALRGYKLLSPAMTAVVFTSRVHAHSPVVHPSTNPASGYVVVIFTNQDHVLLPAIQNTEAMLTAAQKATW